LNLEDGTTASWGGTTALGQFSDETEQLSPERYYRSKYRASTGKRYYRF
jgi:hypothetical protein